MAFKQFLVDQVHPWGGDGAGHHFFRSVEEVTVVSAVVGAVSHDQCCLSAPAGAPAPLGIIGRRGGDIPEVDNIQVGNVDSQFHSG